MTWSCCARKARSKGGEGCPLSGSCSREGPCVSACVRVRVCVCVCVRVRARVCVCLLFVERRLVNVTNSCCLTPSPPHTVTPRASQKGPSMVEVYMDSRRTRSSDPPSTKSQTGIRTSSPQEHESRTKRTSLAPHIFSHTHTHIHPHPHPHTHRHTHYSHGQRTNLQEKSRLRSGNR